MFDNAMRVIEVLIIGMASIYLAYKANKTAQTEYKLDYEANKLQVSVRDYHEIRGDSDSDAINVDYISGKYTNIKFEPICYLVYTYRIGESEQNHWFFLKDYYLTEVSNSGERDNTIYSAFGYKNWNRYVSVFNRLSNDHIKPKDRVQIVRFLRISYNDIIGKHQYLYFEGHGHRFNQVDESITKHFTPQNIIPIYNLTYERLKEEIYKIESLYS